MKINKYSSFTIIYFFLNSFGLPHGLLYTMMLTPLTYLWLIVKRQQLITSKFLFFLAPFVFIHFWLGVDEINYLRSLLIFFTVYIFCYALYIFLLRFSDQLGYIFKMLTIYNFYLAIVALPLYFTPLKAFFWTDGWISPSVGHLPRLKLLTYEPSYYCTLLAPIALYYYLSLIFYPTRHDYQKMALMITLPLLLSFSFGIQSAIVLAVLFFIFTKIIRRFVPKKIINVIKLLAVVVFLIFAFLFFFLPDNPIFQRMSDIFQGEDISGRARTFDSFFLAYQILETTNIWWGVGFGQIKIVGDPIIREYYLYPADFGTVSLPNTLAETLAIFGIIGFSLRIFFEIFLFFKTKVYGNHYRLVVYIFIFIYHFTGSFYTNIAEYAVWILAFSPGVFPHFNSHSKIIRGDENRN